MGLDRIGTFRGIPLECGVSVTAQKKLPQFVVRAKLTEFYDQQENQWFNYAEQEAEITAYLCLYGADKKKGGELGPTLSFDQVKKVFGWDGTSFVTLAKGDYSELQFQLRIGDNTWEEAKTPYQVDWIDEYDADPVRQLRKLDAKELKELDKQFAAQTKQPVKTATKPHPARVPADDGVPPTAAEKKKIMKAKSDRLKAEAVKTEMPEPPEAPEPAPVEAPETPPEEGSCTKSEAWCSIVEMRDESINDKTINKLWVDAIAEVAGPDAVTKKGQKGLTGDQWFQVKEIVLKDCAKF